MKNTFDWSEIAYIYITTKHCPIRLPYLQDDVGIVKTPVTLFRNWRNARNLKEEMKTTQLHQFWNS